MSYFIFDMDETLAELYSVYYFVASLRINEIVKEDYNEELPDILRDKLDKAYKIFVNEVLRKEISAHPLGILRPGILDIMEELYLLQKKGKLEYVLIYSNNGHLESLEFIRDLIHTYLGTNNLIKDCIHWNHHMRNEERTLVPGQPNKTWNVIKKIMVNGNCKAVENLEPNKVYFFDDLVHHDLQKHLGPNYYKVPKYDFKASFNRLADIFEKALIDVNLEMDIFINYILKIFCKRTNTNFTIKDIIKCFKEKTGETAGEDKNPPPPDLGIIMMLDAIKQIKKSSGGGGKRKLKFPVIYTRIKKPRKFYRKKTVKKI